jgi:hypothetical protein
MYKALSAVTVKELEETGKILLLVKKGWEMHHWAGCPHHIYYRIGTRQECIFDCYVSIHNDVMSISNIKPTKLIVSEPSLVDAYLFIALKEMIEYASSLKIKKLIVDSAVTSMAEHLVDLGFTPSPRSTFSGSTLQGYMLLEE